MIKKNQAGPRSHNRDFLFEDVIRAFNPPTVSKLNDIGFVASSMRLRNTLDTSIYSSIC